MSIYTDLPEIHQRTYASNEYAFAFLTNIPITPGHTLIVPKREVLTIDQLTSDEFLAIHALIGGVTGILKQKMNAAGFNFAWNQGADYGQSVPHLHIHVVPRTPGDTGITNYEPRKFLYRPGSREKTPETELAAFAQQLRRETT